jgi:type II secretory ATPase GspE/PulE/Tfp pilus assembly ATPase PilB-like protein
MLRQDPDVILLGEVRDSETANLCFQAASTGHLVLSTLHANSASEAKSRLETLGVSPDLIASCLRFSSTQRLLPKLCPVCRVLDSTNTVSENLNTPFYRKNSNGCAHCYRGAIGRIPILEFIEWNSGGSAISDSTPTTSKSLKEIALESAEKGEVDLYEALKIG